MIARKASQNGSLLLPAMLEGEPPGCGSVPAAARPEGRAARGKAAISGRGLIGSARTGEGQGKASLLCEGQSGRRLDDKTGCAKGFANRRIHGISPRDRQKVFRLVGEFHRFAGGVRGRGSVHVFRACTAIPERVRSTGVAKRPPMQRHARFRAGLFHAGYGAR